MSFTPPSVPAKRLAVAITSAATSFQLNNILGWNGSNLTSSDMGDRAWAVFLNSDKTIMEIMRIDPTTIAASAITITKRGLDFKGGDTEVTANKLNWNAGETTVLLGTNPAQLYQDFVNLYDAQTIAGVKTFSSLPKTTAGNATDDNEFVRKAQLDLAALGTITSNKIVVAGTAGETLVAGNIVYLKASDNRWWKADADAASTAENVQLGIAQGAGSAAGSITNGVLIRGVDINQSGLTANTKYYLSGTAGAMSTSAGTKEVTLGMSLSTTSILFVPMFDQVITEDIQDGLASTTAPSATNLYLTQKDFQLGAEIYGASAAGSDTYAITVSPAPAAYVAGQVFRFKADVANTGAATLNVNGLGAKSIKKNVNAELETNDIIIGQVVIVMYDGTNFQLTTKITNATTRLAGYDAATDTNENTVYTATIPGGLLSKTGGIFVKTPIEFTNGATGGTYTLRLKFGGSTLLTLVITKVGIGGGASSILRGTIDAFIINSGATNTQNVGLYGNVGLSWAGGTLTSIYVSTQPADTTSAIDTTTDQTLTMTVQKSTAGLDGTDQFYQTVIETRVN